MASVRLWNLAGVAVAGAVAASMLSDAPQLNATPNARDVYLGCLTAYYRDHGKHGAYRTMYKAYLACRGQEVDFRAALADQGVEFAAIVQVVDRVNEVNYARFLGVALTDSRGCMERMRRKHPIS